MKYIDADKLIAEIERIKKDAINYPFEEYGTTGTCDKLLSFLDTLEAEKPESLDEAAEEFGKRQGVYLAPFGRKFFKAGAEWMAGQGYSEVADVWSFGKNGIPAIFVDDAMYLPGIEFKPGDKVIVQIRKKQ